MTIPDPLRGRMGAQAAGYAAKSVDAKDAENQLHGDLIKLWDWTTMPATMAGTGQHMTLPAALKPAPPAYVDGMSFRFRPPAANTGPDPDADFGPGPCIIRDRNNNALAAGAYASTGEYVVSYRAATGKLHLALNETEMKALVAPFPRNYLTGFQISNNTLDTANDLDIAAGMARDAADTVNMTGAAMTKRLDAAWAAGNNAGALLMSGNLTGTVTVSSANGNLAGSGTLFTTELTVGQFITTAGGQCRRIVTITSNTAATVESNWSANESSVTYKRGGKARNSVLRIFAIYKDSDGTVDYACAALDTPTDLPTGWSKYRRTRYVLTDSSGNNRQDRQDGDVVTLLTKVTDISAATFTTGASTRPSSAPPLTVARYEWILEAWGIVISGYNISLSVRETAVGANNGRRALAVIDSSGSGNVVPSPASSADVHVALDGSQNFVVDAVRVAGLESLVATANLLGWIDRRGRD